MSTRNYVCDTGIGSLQVNIYKDGSGFDITSLDNEGNMEACIILSKRPTVKAIINQLQEYLDETSESTPA